MSSLKPLLLYSGHSFHEQTGSTKFFLELLEENYRVKILWDESWRDPGQGVRANAINAINPDVVIFFQTLPPRAEIAKIRCRNKIIVPMHDSVVLGSQRVWRERVRRRLRAINFCAATHAFFSQLGYQSLQVQYWPSPKTNVPPSCTGIRIMFWARRSEISWITLKSLLGSLRPEKIVLRCAADPGQTLALPTDEECREYNITIIDGWMEKTQYLELLSSCNVYVAPRLYEGIGHSFLEAMAQGLAVIAPNLPTMNEYIRHNENGYLFDPEKVEPIDFSTLQSIRKRALEHVATGFHTWISQKKDVLAFIDSAKAPMNLWQRLLSWSENVSNFRK